MFFFYFIWFIKEIYEHINILKFLFLLQQESLNISSIEALKKFQVTDEKPC